MTAPTNPTAGPADESPEGDERLAHRGPIQKLLTRPEIGALIGAGTIWVFFWSVSDVFGTVPGANNYLDVSTSLGIMAIAVAMLMIGGEFDLSSGAMTGATGMLVVLLVKDPGEFGGAGLPLAVAIPITFVFAMGVGWANGTLVKRTGLPSFIVTLATFFVLRGAKLGFAKLFTDKVIVEGLDNAPDFAFWSNIFGGVWIRNDHVWDSFLGGRDLLFAVLATLGVLTVTLGLTHLSLVKSDVPRQDGMVVFLVGLGAAIAGLILLTRTDGLGANWIWSIVTGAGVVVAAYGYGSWRFDPASHDRGTISFAGAVGRRAAIGIGLVVSGAIAGMVLDSASEDSVVFLLSVQGLRAMLFVGLTMAGLISLLLAARDADTSPVTRAAVTILTALAVVGVAFVVQAEASSAKFRAEAFAWMLLGALILLIDAVIRLSFQLRRHPDAPEDRIGRMMSILGIGMVVGALVIRLLFSTAEENASIPGVITYRISVLYFFIFATFATWLLTRTKFGSWTYAVGGNAAAARQVGVPSSRTKTQLFMIVSGAAWLVGMLIAFRLNSVQANTGDGLEFFYIIAAVVGGNLLTGGYGSTAGASIGAIIMAMSFQGIPFSGWNSDWRFLFVGVILLLAVMVNNYVRGRAEASK